MTAVAETHSPGEYEALLRTDFASCATACFHELNPRTPFTPGWHHEVIAATLTAVCQRHIRGLIIKSYSADIIECIFHPAALGQPIASLDSAGWNVT